MDKEVRTHIWGEGLLAYPLTEKDFEEARQRLAEEFELGMTVRIVLCQGVFMTAHMVLFFIEMANKAGRAGSNLHLQLCPKLLETLEKVPGATAMVLESMPERV